MDTPLSKFLAPQPADRNIRSATASIATASAMMLAVIAAALIPGSRLYAVIIAAGVAFGAASVIAQLRHRFLAKLYQWLSAVGGVIILAIGLLTALAKLGSSAVFFTAAQVSSFYLVPLAALACFIGGLGQLYPKWILPVLAAVGGAASAGWFSLGAVSWRVSLIVAFSALICLGGCAYPITHALSSPPRALPGWLITAAAALMIPTMLYTLAVAIVPLSLTLPQISPVIIAWAYLSSAILATLSGVLTSSNN